MSTWPPAQSPPPEEPEPAWATYLSNPWIAAGAAFAASALVSIVLWPVLAIPANLLTDVFGDDSKTCGGQYRTGTSGMYWCSARVALWRLVGPIVVIVAALVARRPLSKLVGRLRSSLPSAGRGLVMPVLASTIFTMAFASIHSDTAGGSGYIPQRFVPAVVGLLTHLMPAGGRLLTARAPGFFTSRDRVPAVVRVAGALAIPILISYLTTKDARVDLTNSETREQQTIFMSIALGWLALVPRGGDMSSLASGAFLRNLRRPRRTSP